jgi:hypothetical protein
MKNVKLRLWNKADDTHSIVEFDKSPVPSFLPEKPVVQLYIGKDDINGKNIYVGDIVRRKNTDYIYTVEFDSEDLSFMGRDKDGNLCFLNFEVEVIGNIFQKPENSIEQEDLNEDLS